MKLVIVTGMSGAGKTIALKMLEDQGFYCVDNLPIPLLEPFAQLAVQQPSVHERIALGIDIRSGQELPLLLNVLEDWKQNEMPCQILYLDASDETLVKRYKETRRSHPLAGRGRVDSGIRQERERLGFLKKKADIIIDTSQLLTRELRQELERIFSEDQGYGNLFITVLSFGYKYGIPADADLVFDVRFLPNPFYIDELKHKTGNDQEVQDYVMGYEESHAFMDKLEDMIRFLIPNYVKEGKYRLVIAIGCTGGKHRSVTLANVLFRRLREQGSYGVTLHHRDVNNSGT